MKNKKQKCKYFTNEYDAAKHHSFMRILKWRFTYKNPQQQEFESDDFLPKVIEGAVPDKGIDKPLS